MNARKLALQALNVPPCNSDSPRGVLESVAEFTASELRLLSDAFAERPLVVDVLDGMARRLEIAIQIATEMENERVAATAASRSENETSEAAQ